MGARPEDAPPSGRRPLKARLRRLQAPAPAPPPQQSAPPSEPLPQPPSSVPAAIFRQRGLRAEDELARIALERARQPVDVVEHPLPLNGQRLVLPQARAAEAGEPDRDLLDPRVDVVGELLDRLRGVADLTERALGPRRAEEALGARHQPVELVG